MSTQVVLSALEEELLYVLYDDYLLRHALLSVEGVSVTFDNSQNQFFPRVFSLVFRTNKDQPLILENKTYEGFIQTFQTYKRMETQQDEWLFLDELVDALKEEMPRYVTMIEEILQKRVEAWFASRAFFPEKMELSFHEQTVQMTFNESDLVSLWSTAWHRFANQKKTYLTYMGFTKTQIESLLTMQIESIEEVQIEELTEVRATVLLDGIAHTFSFYKDLSHVHVNGKLAIEEDMFGSFSITSTGRLMGEFFGIEKTKGYDFEKMWKTFLNEDASLYKRSLDGFKRLNTERCLKEVTDKVGLTVKESYVKDDTHVIVLEDGSIFKKG